MRHGSGTRASTLNGSSVANRNQNSKCLQSWVLGKFLYTGRARASELPETVLRELALGRDENAASVIGLLNDVSACSSIGQSDADALSIRRRGRSHSVPLRTLERNRAIELFAGWLGSAHGSHT